MFNPDLYPFGMYTITFTHDLHNIYICHTILVNKILFQKLTSPKLREHIKLFNCISTRSFEHIFHGKLSICFHSYVIIIHANIYFFKCGIYDVHVVQVVGWFPNIYDAWILMSSLYKRRSDIMWLPSEYCGCGGRGIRNSREILPN